MKVHRICTLLLLLVLAGCGGRKLYPVEGTVQWMDGKPAVELAGGAVNFESADGTLSATGPIGPDARYRLSTERTHDGVPAGEYRVVLSAPPSANPDRPTRSVLNPLYQRLETTKLRVTVKEERNDLPLRIER